MAFPIDQREAVDLSWLLYGQGASGNLVDKRLQHGSTSARAKQSASVKLGRQTQHIWRGVQNHFSS